MRNPRKCVSFSIQVREKAAGAFSCLQLSCSTAMRKAGKFRTALLFTVCLTSGGNVMAANFVDEVMDGVLGGMSNVTRPGAYSAANRGVLTGGGVYLRTKIFDPRLITFVPPTFKGGCGGIDLFGGSFSFINADQLVQLFRNIAANAVGLLFQMALAVVCSECSTLIQKFQDIVRELNGMLSNSCEMARGIVTNTKDVLTGQQTMSAALGNMTDGVGDVFESFTNLFSGTNSGSPEQTLINNNPDEASDKNVYGNLVWKAVNDNSLPARYLFRGDDTARILMSVTGTVIVEKPETSTTPSSSGSGTNTTDATSPVVKKDSILSIADFIEGPKAGAASRYKCSDGDASDACLTVDTENFTFTGFKARLYNDLCGTTDLNAACTGGVVYALATNNGASGSGMSQNQEQVIVALPGEIGSYISMLATMGTSLSSNPTSSAGFFVKNNIGSIALLTAYDTVDQIYQSVLQTLHSQKGAYAEDAIKMIEENRKKVMAEFAVQEGIQGNLIDVTRHYQELLTLYGHTPSDITQMRNRTSISNAN